MQFMGVTSSDTDSRWPARKAFAEIISNRDLQGATLWPFLSVITDRARITPFIGHLLCQSHCIDFKGLTDVGECPGSIEFGLAEIGSTIPDIEVHGCSDSQVSICHIGEYFFRHTET